MSHVVALDQGTTSSRAIVFDAEARPVASAQREFTQHYPAPGWVEHDPEEIWRSQRDTMAQAIDRAGIRHADVRAVGITNQRETTLLWDRATGECVHNAIVWQDRRTAALCDAMKGDGRAALVRERTGLVVDAYFSATKIAWMLDNVPGLRRRAEAGELAFGTVDSWLVWRLTGRSRHVTDVSNASRTMLWDIHRGEWDDELLAVFGVPRELLPDVVPSAGPVAPVAPGLPAEGAPICGVAGDQQAALVGQLCVASGMSKCTYGTGCFLLMHTGDQPRPSDHGLLTTVAYQHSGHPLQYAIEGGVFVGGAIIQWLRDGLGIISSAPECDTLAASVADANGCVLVPALAGLGAPHWDQHARGALVGLTRGVTRAHVCRAALEGIAFSVAELLDAMRSDAHADISEVRADGGAAASDPLLQIQSDVLQVPVVRPEYLETTAAGAAYLAGIASGLYPSFESLASTRRDGRRFEPSITASEAARQLDRWRRAVERSRDWANHDATTEPADQ